MSLTHLWVSPDCRYNVDKKEFQYEGDGAVAGMIGVVPCTGGWG